MLKIYITFQVNYQYLDFSSVNFNGMYIEINLKSKDGF